MVAAHRWRGRRWSALAAQAAVVHWRCWSGAVRSRAGGVRAAVAKAARGSAMAACRRAWEWRRLRRQAAAQERRWCEGKAAAARDERDAGKTERKEKPTAGKRNI